MTSGAPGPFGCLHDFTPQGQPVNGNRVLPTFEVLGLPVASVRTRPWSRSSSRVTVAFESDGEGVADKVVNHGCNVAKHFGHRLNCLLDV